MRSQSRSVPALSPELQLGSGALQTSPGLSGAEALLMWFRVLVTFSAQLLVTTTTYEHTPAPRRRPRLGKVSGLAGQSLQPGIWPQQYVCGTWVPSVHPVLRTPAAHSPMLVPGGSRSRARPQALPCLVPVGLESEPGQQSVRNSTGPRKPSTPASRGHCCCCGRSVITFNAT